MSERLLRYALLAFVVGLALHNLVMAELWDAGVHGSALDVVAAWKDVLLVAALGYALWTSRRIPLGTWADRFALAYAAVLLLYAVLPQDWLGGEATSRGILYALRHDLVPVGAYFLGRLLGVASRDRARVGLVIVATALGLTLYGLIDVYVVPLQWWRDSGVPGWFHEQLGLDYKGLSGLPENWVYNTGDETNPIRRLVSTFLSPLATAYLLVVALLYLATRPRTRLTLASAAVCFIGLLFTHTRAAYLALAVGLIVIGVARRRWWPVLAAAGTIVLSVAFVAAYPSIGPDTSYTKVELDYLRQHAQQHPGTSAEPLSGREASTSSHLRNLRDGLETVLRHPQGYGLGNAGVSAKRTGVEIKAGESIYTELGVEAGVVGALLFVAWSVAVLIGLWSRSVWLLAAFAAVLVLGLQTDVIGVHWLSYVLWALAGAALSGAREDSA